MPEIKKTMKNLYPNPTKVLRKNWPRGLGFITRCPLCNSKKLKDESGFIIEGVSCENCGWNDIDGGVDSGC